MQHKHNTRHIKKTKKPLRYIRDTDTQTSNITTSHNVYLELILYSAKNAIYPSGHLTCFLIWQFFS